MASERLSESTLDNIAAAIPVSGGYSVHVKPDDLASLLAEVRQSRAQQDAFARADEKVIALADAYEREAAALERAALARYGLVPLADEVVAKMLRASASATRSAVNVATHAPALSAADVEALRVFLDSTYIVREEHTSCSLCMGTRASTGSHECDGGSAPIPEVARALAVLARLTSAGGGR